MATITRESIGTLNDKLIVNLSKNDYLPAFEKSLKDYAKKANIPGFRKGMVPSSLVKKMYGNSVFSDEVLRTVEKELNNYVETEKLDMLGQPLPLESDTSRLDVNHPGDYVFHFEIGLKPDVNIDVHNIHVTKYKIAVTDAMIDDETNRLQLRNGNMTDREAIDNDENVLNLEWKETDEEGNETEGGIKKENSLLLKYFTGNIKNQLTGKKVGDSIVIQLSKAFESKERERIMNELALDTSSDVDVNKFFIFTIRKIGLVEKSSLNEDFYNSVYPGRDISNEEEFREAVKQELQKSYDVQSSNQVHDQIYHQLVDHTQLDFPESFLKRWLQMTGDKPKTAEEAGEEYPKYANQLKWSLIVSKLTADNNITVDPDDIKQLAKDRLMSYMGGQSFNDVEWMDDYANRMMKDKKFVENSYYEVQTTKLFNTLEQQVKATEESISEEDFTAKLHHHHH